MKGLDLNPQEFMFLYDLLSAQYRSDTDPALITLRNKFRSSLLKVLEDKEGEYFDKWTEEQKKKISQMRNVPDVKT
jgi:hypothetical protein